MTVAKILVVDDSWLIRKVVGGYLRKEGHEVVEGENGRQCLDLAETQKPDLVVLDLLMPELGGMEVLEALGRAGLDLPVIVLTADIQETTHQQCRDLGVRHILQKPPRGSDILAAVKQIIGQPA
jgi:twitching motility two-component system response regulator PilH